MSGTTPPPPDPTSPFGSPPAPQPAPASPAAGGPSPLPTGDPGVEATRPLPPDTVSFGSSEGTPPPPPGYADPAAFGGGEPPAGRSHKGVIAAILVALAMIAGGGAFAFVKVDPLHLFHAGPQAAEAIPDTAIAYFGVDLDPSAQQKVDAIRFLEHFPGFTKSTGIDDTDADIREVFIDEALQSSDCDLTYADDFEPWLGTKLGVGILPPENEGEGAVPMMALEVSDVDAAKKTFDAVEACERDKITESLQDAFPGASSGGDDSPSVGLASSGDYLVVADSQDQADRYAKAAESASLADSAEFKADMESLGDLGVVTGWADASALIGLASDYAGSLGGSLGTEPDFGVLTAQTARVAGTLRFSSDHAEVVVSSIGDSAPIDHPDNEIVDLPDTTVLAASVAGGGDRLAAQWDDLKKALAAQGTDVDEALSELESETGLSVPTDIETLLGDNLLVAVDGEGLSADSLQGGLGGFDPRQLNLGVRFSGDKADLDDLYERVLDLVQQQTGAADVPFSKVDFDSGFAMATNDDYGQTLADLDGDLGDTADFKSVIDDGAGSSFAFYFDWNAIEDDVLDLATQAGAEQGLIDNLKPLRAFGISNTASGDYSLTTMRVSVDD